jgi:hypothetical protein
MVLTRSKSRRYQQQQNNADHYITETVNGKERKTHKLTWLFNKLSNWGILVKEDFCCCGSCGLREIRELTEKKEEEEGVEVRGYCFYHGQDLDHAAESGELWLGHAENHDGDEETEVANTILMYARKVGIQAEWSGSMKDRVCLKQVDKSYFQQKIDENDEEMSAQEVRTKRYRRA